jgi:hypothetical protein
LEDEGVLHSKELVIKDPIACFLKWLRLSLQWTQGVSTLTKTLGKPVKFWAVEQPPTSKGNKQASLDELFSQVLYDHPAAIVNSAIKRLQKRAAQEIEREDSGNSKAWKSLTAQNWDLWELKFFGKHHCESVLASIRNCNYEEVAKSIPKDQQKRFRELVEELQVCDDSSPHNLPLREIEVFDHHRRQQKMLLYV